MSGFAVRRLVGVGVLAVAFLIAGGGVAIADPDGTGGGDVGGNEAGAVDTAGSGGADDRREAGTVGEPPTSTIGSGRQDTKSDVPTVGAGERAADLLGPLFKNSLDINILRVPALGGAAARNACPSMNPCLTTTQVPIPTVEGALTYLQPDPEPSPGRPGIQREEPPVVDVSGNDRPAPGRSAVPPVMEFPVLAPPMGVVRVAAPPPEVIQPAPRAPAADPGVTPRPAGAGAAPAGPREAGPALPAATPPPGGQGASIGNTLARLGFDRYTPAARISQMVLVAVPGVLGLLMITAGGGVVGYRQADAGRYLRVGADRFLP